MFSFFGLCFFLLYYLKLSFGVGYYVFITPPARRAWRSYKFASLSFSFGVESWAAAHG